MKMWNDYKNYVKNIDQYASGDIEEAEQLAYIISTIIDRRKELGLSQRDLASKLSNVRLFKDSLVKIIGDIFDSYDSLINLFGGQCQII